MMTSSSIHQLFDSLPRVSQSLRSDRCQNILYKAVFEHFTETSNIAALLLTSKSFQNSSFGANFLINFVVDENTISLVEAVLSPSSCFSLQFVPSLHIDQSGAHSEKIHRGFSNWASEMINTKYLPLSLRSLWLERVNFEVLSAFFGSSTSNAWRQLQHLNLKSCEVNDRTLALISENAAQLRIVNLSDNSSITDSGLGHLSKLSNITSLNISQCVTTDAGIERISKLSDITFLDVSCSSKVSDASLEHIVKLSSINSLYLRNCELISDVGLEHISRLSSITVLDLGFCREITNAGLEHLAKLSGITSLNLNGCKLITDAGIEHISKLSNITSLSVNGCSKIKDEAKQKLMTAVRQRRK